MDSPPAKTRIVMPDYVATETTRTPAQASLFQYAVLPEVRIDGFVVPMLMYWGVPSAPKETNKQGVAATKDYAVFSVVSKMIPKNTHLTRLCCMCVCVCV